MGWGRQASSCCGSVCSPEAAPMRETASLCWARLTRRSIYFALHLIPSAVTVYLIPTVFLPAFGLAIIVLSPDIDATQSMFEDVPYEHPKVYRAVDPRLLATRALRGRDRRLRWHHALARHRRPRHGHAGEHALHGRVAAGVGRAARGVAAQEPQAQHDRHVPHRVPPGGHRHPASAAASQLVREMACRHPLRGLLGGDDAHDASSAPRPPATVASTPCSSTGSSAESCTRCTTPASSWVHGWKASTSWGSTRWPWWRSPPATCWR